MGRTHREITRRMSGRNQLDRMLRHSELSRRLYAQLSFHFDELRYTARDQAEALGILVGLRNKDLGVVMGLAEQSVETYLKQPISRLGREPRRAVVVDALVQLLDRIEELESRVKCDALPTGNSPSAKADSPFRLSM